MMPAGAQRLRFGLAVAALAGCAIGLQMAEVFGWVALIKKPSPIRKPLLDLDRRIFEPLAFKFMSSDRLDVEMVGELGTEEYINWVFEYTGTRPLWRGPVRLSVTYYTGKQDQIPHVPEECLWQGGLSPAGGDRTLNLQPSWLEGAIPIHRVVFFPRPADGTKIFDYYTICVNTEFFANRTDVRLRMAKPGDTHLFYSKIEVMFMGVTDQNLAEVDRTALEILGCAAAELTRSHYPLKGWEKGGPPAAGGSAGSGS